MLDKILAGRWLFLYFLSFFLNMGATLTRLEISRNILVLREVLKFWGKNTEEKILILLRILVSVSLDFKTFLGHGITIENKGYFCL